MTIYKKLKASRWFLFNKKKQKQCFLYEYLNFASNNLIWKQKLIQIIELYKKACDMRVKLENCENA